MWTRRLYEAGLLAAGLAGCQFDAPSFDGAGYLCAPPTSSCPPGSTCRDGHCTTESDEPSIDIDAAAGETGTVRVDVAYDTTIRSETPTTGDGSQEFLEIDAEPAKVTLVAFDLSVIPPDATVIAAQLDAWLFDPVETGTLQLYSVTEDWSDDATWIERSAGVPWSAPGADPPASDRSRLLGELAPDVIGPITLHLDLVEVQTWVSSPDENRGIVFISTSPDGRGGQLRSSEHPIAGERPVLRVSFLLP